VFRTRVQVWEKPQASTESRNPLKYMCDICSPTYIEYVERVNELNVQIKSSEKIRGKRNM